MLGSILGYIMAFKKKSNKNVFKYIGVFRKHYISAYNHNICDVWQYC